MEKADKMMKEKDKNPGEVEQMDRHSFAGKHPGIVSRIES